MPLLTRSIKACLGIGLVQGLLLWLASGISVPADIPFKEHLLPATQPK